MSSSPSAACLMDVVEAAYALDGDDQSWLASLAAAASPALDRGLGVVAYIGETKTLKAVSYATAGAAGPIEKLLMAVSDQAPREVQESFIGQPLRFVSVSETFFGDAILRGHWEAAGRAFGLADGVGLYAHAAKGCSVHLFAASPKIEQPTKRERRAWERVASHLAAGHRVRSMLRGKQAANDSSSSALRDAVRDLERINPNRSNPEQALSLWQGLVDGRWSLLDRWESDGKRFIAAVENRPDSPDPRSLRPRESAAAQLAARGASPKEIACALDISPSNARALLASALSKLGLSRRSDLFRWNPAEAHVHSISQNPRVETLVIPDCSVKTKSQVFSDLSTAEKDVAELAADGKSNEEIAATRGKSVRTIANQMAAILRKLGVSSRAEILRTLQPA